MKKSAMMMLVTGIMGAFLLMGSTQAEARPHRTTYKHSYRTHTRVVVRHRHHSPLRRFIRAVVPRYRLVQRSVRVCKPRAFRPGYRCYWTTRTHRVYY